MRKSALLGVGSSVLVLFTNFAVAGGAATAAIGPGSVAGTAANADGDGSGHVKKMNQYSVKSYALMRQLLATADAKGAAAGAPAAEKK